MRVPVLVALLLATATTSSGAPSLTRSERRCQRVFGPATDHVGAARAVCVIRCDAKAARGKASPGDCVPPYGDLTRACIAAAERRALAVIARACAADCPECYAGGDCASYGSGAVAVTGTVVDMLVERVLCDDGASGDGLTPAEDRCRRRAGAVLAVAARKMGECFVRCRAREARGLLPAQACATTRLPAETQRCLDGVAARARRQIAGPCTDAPECMGPPDDLVATIAIQIAADYELLIFCASPSGAFVDYESTRTTASSARAASSGDVARRSPATK